MRVCIFLFFIAVSSLLLSACDRSQAPQDAASAGVSDERLVNAEAEPHNWLNHGRTYSEQRFSPLAQINAGNVAQLKLAWHLDLPSKRGLEATPLVVDGRMYTTGTWSRVYALDAASGNLLWEYDRRCRPRRVLTPVATWSTAALRCGATWFTWVHWMAD